MNIEHYCEIFSIKKTRGKVQEEAPVKRGYYKKKSQTDAVEGI